MNRVDLRRGNVLDSNSGSAHLEYRLEHGIFWLRFLWFSTVPVSKCLDNISIKLQAAASFQILSSLSFILTSDAMYPRHRIIEYPRRKYNLCRLCISIKWSSLGTFERNCGLLFLFVHYILCHNQLEVFVTYCHKFCIHLTVVWFDVTGTHSL
jgi:hypothetical protein